jgi:hypothetical protein
MPKIVASHQMVPLFDGTKFVVRDDIRLTPNDCDVIVHSIFNNSDPTKIIEALLKKTKYLIVDISEFTDVNLCDRVEQLHERYSNLQVISTVVPNYPSRLKFSGHWFMSSYNFYKFNSTNAWAIDRLDKLRMDESDRPYIVECLLGRQTESRDFIESKYSKSADKNKFVFSYFKDNIKEGIWDFSVDSVKYTSEAVSVDKENFCLSATIPYYVYNQTYYSVVAETVFFNKCNYYTEKIIKPILGKRPFVVFAGQNYLANLKKLGFKTFDNIIDESYDTIPDHRRRWTAAWQQLEFLIQQDPGYIYQQTEQIREHNYNFARSTDWNLEIKKLINTNLGVDVFEIP